MRGPKYAAPRQKGPRADVPATLCVSRDMPSWAADDDDSGIASFLQTGAAALDEEYKSLSPMERTTVKTAAKGWFNSLLGDAEAENIDHDEP